MRPPGPPRWGPDAMAPVLLSGPDMSPAELTATTSAFDSGWIAPLGPYVDAFEQQMADRLGRRHAVALSSGTAALHLGLLAWGDRKSTRLNSSHVASSYAVFCLKKQ